MSLARRCYSLLLYCALPGALLWFLWKGRHAGAARGNLAARLGMGLPRCDDHPLWLHAASVGEVRSLAPLLQMLQQRGLPLLLTVGTPTGLAQARKLYGGWMGSAGPDARALVLQAAPWDLPGAVRRFLRASQPRIGVFVETELWPNLLAAASRAGVPLVLVSARLSSRSLSRYLHWAPGLMRDTVRAFGAIAAQTGQDRARLLQLGASPQAVSVGGSLKSEGGPAAGTVELAAAWRDHWAAHRPLWIAGSTHAGEETICLAAQRQLLIGARRRGDPPPLLALAPRHPQRFDAVAREAAAAGFAVARSTQPPQSDLATIDVLLIDEMGALPVWYAAGDAAFVGGSLVPAGGHNLLEPAMHGKPVLAGPHDAGAPEIARRLRDCSGLTIVRDADELAAALDALLRDPVAARLRGAQARTAAAADPPASPHALELIERLLPR
ncbi:MAG TPA: glycosyltransferase N-terminal domain-containing protein [Steroidobacteraceae bacterium]|nr:glycosyltransferase N-terminal domain-containing protein [Steroidobacteraceae bacterium]